MLIVLKILAAWTAVSVVSSFAVAPALSRRIREVNFPPEMDGPADRYSPDATPPERMGE
ncbi:hypothetical protein [Bradyrhizobium sp.]|uniref:hypothetical protein n=1 Tax=Bradyrhizobium sp. TaxID=376 RepID=UPI002D62376D|nr:hypothetical protein [Bradyrhizobium sp.]HZR71765.1 hypothetical protein [Bradyrhizobium sp.]